MITWKRAAGVALAVLALAPAASAGAKAPRYKYTPLGIGDFAGIRSWYGFGVNDKGKVIGDWLSDSNFYHTYSRTKGTTITPLAPPLGSIESKVRGINARGLMVGMAYDNDQVTTPILWSTGGIPLRLPVPEGFAGAFAYDINDSAQIAIVLYDAQKHSFPGIVKKNASGMYETLPISDGVNGWPYAINNKGSIVVAEAPEGPYVWTAGRVKRLKLPSGAATAEPRDINDAGLVVGLAAKSTAGGTIDIPVVWEKGKVSALPLLAGAVQGFATGVTNKGDIVGTVISATESRGVLWQRSGKKWKVYDLNKLAPLPAATLITVGRKISSKGLITGWAVVDGQERAYLLTPR
jgi:uncharacterized membrane protein